MTKKLLLATAALAISGAANAAINVSTSSTAATGPYVDLTNPTNFNGTTRTTSVPGIAAQPTGSVGAYGVAGPGPNINNSILSFANYATTGVASVKFIWGTVDSYNTLNILGPGNTVLQSITGNQILPGANGSTQVNFVLNLTGADRKNVTGLQFNSTNQAFEFANVAVGVPEPAAWAMMIGGFGLVGAMARRRRGGTTAVTA